MTTTLFSDAIRALMPAATADESAYPPAFAAIADLVLNRATLRVADAEHRFTEIEFYFKGRKHIDKFTHGDPMQKQFGRWYFHRTAGEYRGGTYKGLDIAFGFEDAPAGILVRGIERLGPPAALIDGPCMVVDHILALTQSPAIPDLVAKFDLSVDVPANGTSPLAIELRPTSHGRTLYATPRVGLTLKRANTPDRHRFIAREYRYLTEPERIKKGKLHLVTALHRQGRSLVEICSITGSKAAHARGYIEAFEHGRIQSPAVYNAELNTADTCSLFGACAALP